MPLQTFDTEVIIIGAGLAGLACARELHAHKIPFLLLEASDGVGGRVRTDKVDGYLLDRGFQVLPTAYAEAKRVLDFDRLHLHSFLSGAIIHTGSNAYRIADPFRNPLAALESLLTPIGSMRDKLLLLWLRERLRRTSVESVFSRKETNTFDALISYGFSPTIITHFFRPFLSGIFLEKELKTSSRMFEFVYKSFSQGTAALPAEGMGAIPSQLAKGLPAESIRLNVRVQAVAANSVQLVDGQTLKARSIVIGTEGPEAARLLPEIASPESRSTTTMYFSTDRDPVGLPILVLNGGTTGLINNLCVPNTVAPSYAPRGKSLVSVSIVGEQEESEELLLTSARAQLKSWFGTHVETWTHLRTYRIRHALPALSGSSNAGFDASPRVREGTYVCGDHRGNASIEGALVSGRRAAEAIIRDIGQERSGNG